MTTCAVCEGILLKDDIHVTCAICFKLFHADYTNGNNCAEINASEKKIVNIKKKKYAFVYRCKKCENAGGINNNIIEIMKKMNENLAKVEEFNQRIDVFINKCVSLEKFTESIEEIDSYLKTVKMN